MSMRKLLIAAVVLLAGLVALSHWNHRPLHPAAGVLAPDAPTQVNLDDGARLQHGDVTLVTRAHFELIARVLSRKDYSWSADSELIPLDLALGWGRMSDSTVLAKIDITQSDRFYHWHVKDFPIPRREIERSSANMHLIPANAGLEKQLEQVREGQLVHIEGFLVDASRADGWHWNTSMTRDDTGAGACELVYVERVDVVAP